MNRLGSTEAPGKSLAGAARIALLQAKLAVRLGDGARLITDESSRQVYARDLADLPPLIERVLFRTTPLLVIQPRDANDIALVMQLANEERIPVFPRGIASSAYGGPVPTTDGIVVDMSPLQTIDLPHANGKEITVDAGARWGDVEDELARHDLQLFTYPSNRLATVAGWLAGGGFGLNGARYGHVSKYVAALELVTPRGETRCVRDGDADFFKYFASEGLMGIITRVTLRVREKSKHVMRRLLYFESDREAFGFVKVMLARGLLPTSVEFFDAHLQGLLNELHRSGAPIASASSLPCVRLLEKPALLVFVDDAETEDQLSRFLREQSPCHPSAESAAYIAGSLWADRFFPMEIRSLGPSLLAAEIVLPLDEVAAFLAHARRLADRFGLELATTGHLLSTATGIRVLTMPMFLTDINRIAYPLHLAFVSVLDRAAGKHSGTPYNLGIWHAPFIDERLTAEAKRDLCEFKRAQDPQNILNPGKYLRVQSRFLGLPGLLFHPLIFKLAMDALMSLSMFLSSFTRKPSQTARRQAASAADIARPQLETSAAASYDQSALALTATACTSCGACVSVCPAYVHTKDERVTGRAKMWLARQVASGGRISKTAADAAWLCVRCRACALVCQAQLPLMAAYEKLEEELEKRFRRPDGLIQEFVAGMERNPEYRARVGLSLPIELMEQRWQKLFRNQIVAPGQRGAPDRQPVADPSSLSLAGKQVASSASVMSPQVVLEPGASMDLPEPAHTRGGKYHIAARVALPRQPLLGKFTIDRNEQCVSCGHCVEACIYGVHFRNPLDVRRMNAPKDELCRGCFRCIQECPRAALTISFDGDYARTGRGAFTGDVISSLARQADEGRIPVFGAGYRGAFAGPGFDSMWTDMSEIVRPTRDGIHGREYISTAVDLGRRPTRLESLDGLPTLPPYVEIPLPILFGELPIHRTRPVLLAVARAARSLGTFAMISRRDWFEALGPFRRHLALSASADDLDEFIAPFRMVEIADPMLLPRVREVAPNAVVAIRVDVDALDPAHICDLARAGAQVIHLSFDPVDAKALVAELPHVHRRLVDEGQRDAITIVAGGAIAMAEHVPKTIILGADAVTVDLPVAVALECVLDDQCFGGGGCTRAIEDIDPAWGEQRVINLMASWRNQLLEVLGAMGMREVRRLRGERGRAMFKSELDEKLLAPIFSPHF